MTYADLRDAVAVFGLGEEFTMRQLRSRHRELALKHHPDRTATSETSEIIGINEAYRLLRQYCDNYLFSCTEKEFYRQNPDERLRLQFSDLWEMK